MGERGKHGKRESGGAANMGGILVLKKNERLYNLAGSQPSFQFY